jgi:hypothetical protein
METSRGWVAAILPYMIAVWADGDSFKTSTAHPINLSNPTEKRKAPQRRQDNPFAIYASTRGLGDDKVKGIVQEWVSKRSGSAGYRCGLPILLRVIVADSVWQLAPPLPSVTLHLLLFQFISASNNPPIQRLHHHAAHILPLLILCEGRGRSP